MNANESHPIELALLAAMAVLEAVMVLTVAPWKWLATLLLHLMQAWSMVMAASTGEPISRYCLRTWLAAC